MPEATEATEEQYEEMDCLASAKGYPDCSKRWRC